MPETPPPPPPESLPTPPAAPSADREAPPLSDADRALLDFESHVFRSVGAKEKRIREVLGLTPVQYHVRLNQLLDQREAIAYAPALVHRLRARRRR